MSLQTGLIHYLAENKIINSVPAYYTVFFVAVFAVIAVSYLLGSINSAIIISRCIYHDDVRKHGSGNPGTTNMLRTFGKGAALLTLVGDMLKTALSILFAGFLFGFWYFYGISMNDGYCYIAGLFAILGHIFPVYYKFKGGKGVLCTATMVLILSPIPFALLLTLFILIVVASKYVSLGSVSAGVLYPVLLHGAFGLIDAIVEKPIPQSGLISLSSIIVAILIVWCHRANLQRISDRTENKISFKKKTPEPEEMVEDDDEE